MGFWDFLALHMMHEENKKQRKAKKQQDLFDFDTQCESCEELLEDCECDDEALSMEEIAMMDMLDEDDENF